MASLGEGSTSAGPMTEEEALDTLFGLNERICWYRQHGANDESKEAEEEMIRYLARRRQVSTSLAEELRDRVAPVLEKQDSDARRKEDWATFGTDELALTMALMWATGRSYEKRDWTRLARGVLLLADLAPTIYEALENNP